MEILIDFISSIDWKTISSVTIILAVILWAVIKLFAKSFINSIGEKTAELMTIKQKTEIEETIKNEFNKSLEILKSELEKKNIAFEVNYTTFFTKRTEIIISIIKKLVTFYSCAKESTTTNKNNKELSIEELKFNFEKYAKGFNDSLIDFNNYLSDNSILLTKELNDKIVEYYCSIKLLMAEYFDWLYSNDKKEIDIINNLNRISQKIEKEKYEEYQNLLKIFRGLVQPKVEF